MRDDEHGVAVELMAGARAAAAPAITVLLIDDSPLARRLARRALATLPGCTVVAEGSSGRDAVELTRRLRPSVVVLDLNLPHLPGLAAIGQIMAASPTPIVVISGDVGDVTSQAGAEALAAGAVSLLPKPRLSDGQDAETHAEALRRAVSLASRARVITHPRPGPRVLERSAPQAVSSAPSASWTPSVPATDRPAVELVVIGASTGGPSALADVLAGLPAEFPAPVLVVQHMGEAFIAGLATWLAGRCVLPVAVGTEGQPLLPGTVTIAPGGGNTEITEGLVLRLSPAAPEQWHVPSVDRAFSTAAATAGAAVVGVLLTGMGRDGAAGLAEIRVAGGHTVAQDEASSAVWGMPGAAVAAGAAEAVLPLDGVRALLGRLS